MIKMMLTLMRSCMGQRGMKLNKKKKAQKMKVSMKI
jgi:hypothetical protein